MRLSAQVDSILNKPETTRLKPSPLLNDTPKNSVVQKTEVPKRIVVIDSTRLKDSLATIALADSIRNDSIKKAQSQVAVAAIKDTSTYAAIMPIPGLPFGKPLLYAIEKERNPQSKDDLFYLLAAVVLFMGLIKLSFPKYFQNLLRLFFQTSFRQKQTRDQLLQDYKPSLLLNALFLLSGGIYIGLVAQEQGFIKTSFYTLFLYGGAALGTVYLGKYLFLRFSGWVFNVKEAANTYIFVVFLVNKLIGVLLVPFLLLVAFSSHAVVQQAVTVSLVGMGIMLFYRFLVGLGTIRRDLKVSALHFFLYLCAVEILPLMLICKTLFNYIGKSI